MAIGTWRMRLFLALVACILHVVRCDLQYELYQDAKRSPWLRALPAEREALERFIMDRAKPNVAVMFHDGSCGICRRALPEFARLAQEMQDQPVVFAHMDSSSSREPKEWLRLRGFPALFFWRSTEQLSKTRLNFKDLLDKELTVSSDVDFLVRASRQAKMGEENDPARMLAAGKTGKVLKVDLFDLSVQLDVDSGKAWFPVETLLQDGEPLPFLRVGEGVNYRGMWDFKDLQSFVRRLLRPVVARLKSAAKLDSLLEEEQWPALVLCADKVSPGFLEVVAAHQRLMRAFHASTEDGCPVRWRPASSKASQLVVYSPARQQWSPDGRAAAAVIVAGPKVVEDAGALHAWVPVNRFPGITRLSYHNFQEWLADGRHCLLVAADFGGLPEAVRANAMVYEKLREVGKPQPSASGPEVWTLGPQDRYLGVADGFLEGMDSYGVSKWRLPQVVYFLSKDRWVEDSDELTVKGLPYNLERVPQMWQVGHDISGRILSLGQWSEKLFLMYRRHPIRSSWVKCVLADGLLVFIVLAQLYMVSSWFRSLITALVSGDAVKAD